MSKQIIKQPNGKYCIFESMVDNLTHYDMDEKEIVEMFVEKYRKEITEDVRKKVEQLERNENPYHQFTMSYKEALETINRVHGKKTAEEINNLINKKEN